MKRNGFTLLELLVSLAIVGILTGIAVPQFAAYKQKAYDSTALSDLRAVALAEEAYYIEGETYLACTGAECLTLPGMTALSKGVSLTVTVQEDSFRVEAKHSKGTGKIFVWDSLRGGLVT